MWLGPALAVEWGDGRIVGESLVCDERCDGRQLLDPKIGTVGRWQGEGCVDLGVGQRRLSTVLFVW